MKLYSNPNDPDVLKGYAKATMEHLTKQAEARSAANKAMIQPNHGTAVFRVRTRK
jgi:hypothetical protein